MPPSKHPTQHSKRRLIRWRWVAAGLIGVGIVWILTQPRWLFRLASQVMPGAIYQATLPQDVPPTVALTIDDGPGPHTKEILRVLDEYDVQATFFNITGHLPGYESVVGEAIASNHELGNHLTVDEASIRLSDEQFEQSLLTAEQSLTALSPSPLELSWLRPGMGFYNRSMVQTAADHGYRLVLGSVFPYDTHIPSAPFATAFILNTVQPGDIIVLHDGQGKHAARGDRTAKILAQVLPVLRRRGITVTTVSNLMDMTTP